jgi:hypothetical protein
MAESIIHKEFKRALAEKLKDMGYTVDVEVPRKEGGTFDVYGARGNEHINVEIWNTHLPDWTRLPEWIKYLLDSWIDSLPDWIIRIGGKTSDREYTSYRTQRDDLHNKEDLKKEGVGAYDIGFLKRIDFETWDIERLNGKDTKIIIRKIISDTIRHHGQHNSKTLSIREKKIIDREINNLILYASRERTEEQWWMCDPERCSTAEFITWILCQELGIPYIAPTEPRFRFREELQKAIQNGINTGYQYLQTYTLPIYRPNLT